MPSLRVTPKLSRRAFACSIVLLLGASGMGITHPQVKDRDKAKSNNGGFWGFFKLLMCIPRVHIYVHP